MYNFRSGNSSIPLPQSSQRRNANPISNRPGGYSYSSSSYSRDTVDAKGSLLAKYKTSYAEEIAEYGYSGQRINVSSILCMREYEKTSIEELRLIDYKVNRNHIEKELSYRRNGNPQYGATNSCLPRDYRPNTSSYTSGSRNYTNPFAGSSGVGSNTTSNQYSSVPRQNSSYSTTNQRYSSIPYRNNTSHSNSYSRQQFQRPNTVSSQNSFSSQQFPGQQSSNSAPFSGQQFPNSTTQYYSRSSFGNQNFGSNSFGSQMPNPSPFGNQMPHSNPFGSQMPNPNPFGSQMPHSNPFGSQMPNPSPFSSQMPHSNPFGSQMPHSNPFGSQMPTSNPFGSQMPTSGPFGSQIPNSNPFGSQMSNPNPFSQMANANPFGSQRPYSGTFNNQFPNGNQMQNFNRFGSQVQTSNPFGSQIPNSNPFSAVSYPYSTTNQPHLGAYQPYSNQFQRVPYSLTNDRYHTASFVPNQFQYTGNTYQTYPNPYFNRQVNIWGPHTSKNQPDNEFATIHDRVFYGRFGVREIFPGETLETLMKKPRPFIPGVDDISVKPEEDEPKKTEEEEKSNEKSDPNKIEEGFVFKGFKSKEELKKNPKRIESTFVFRGFIKENHNK